MTPAVQTAAILENGTIVGELRCLILNFVERRTSRESTLRSFPNRLKIMKNSHVGLISIVILFACPTSMCGSRNGREATPSVTPDGGRLCFSSDRAGGLGGSDIWVAEKICQRPPQHHDFLRETLHLNFTHPVFSEVVDRITEKGMPLEQKLETLYYHTRDSLTFAAVASLYASEVLEKGEAICYNKAMVFVSFCRLLGVPAALAKAEFIFHDKPEPHLHGIAKVFFKGRWIYIDTVSNREAWGYWDKANADAFQAPVFTLEHNVLVGKPFLKDVVLGDYQTNDVPKDWLDSMKSFMETGK
ncbi:MAG: transglutaminase domain-containing protein, partial [Candidatus Aminicenantales bacterium]